jgi:hypothetical protein
MATPQRRSPQVLLLLLLAGLALVACAQPATATPTSKPHHPPPHKRTRGDATDAARRAAKRDALLTRRALRDAEKLARKSLKACFDNNPGCVECVPTADVAGLYVCATLALGDAACAWPSWVANPASDGVVNGCTCLDGWGSTDLSFKKWRKEGGGDAFIGTDKFLCRERCGGGGTTCADAAFNPASCICVIFDR